jgi:hypothetical protein
VAGHLLGIHPLDQPKVQESKDNTARVLDHPVNRPVAEAGHRNHDTGFRTTQAAVPPRRLRCHLGLYGAFLQDGIGHSLATKSARLPSSCNRDHRLWSTLSPFDRPTPQGRAEDRNLPTAHRSDDP